MTSSNHLEIETPTLKLIAIADKFKVRSLAGTVLDNPRFPVWAGASKPHQHHYGKGGLAQHVLEVCELCLQTNNYFDKIGQIPGIAYKAVDPCKLFLAALFHDAGKMWDYEPVDSEYKEWKGNDHRLLIHHISRSALLWHEASKNEDWKPVDQDEVLHCILSHHGQKEWGSPVQPRTRMAWMLHLCDGISARIDDCDKRIPFSTDPLIK
jgi:3'-5' exoribonuclease